MLNPTPNSQLPLDSLSLACSQHLSLAGHPLGFLFVTRRPLRRLLTVPLSFFSTRPSFGFSALSCCSPYFLRGVKRTCFLDAWELAFRFCDLAFIVKRIFLLECVSYFSFASHKRVFLFTIIVVAGMHSSSVVFILMICPTFLRGRVPPLRMQVYFSVTPEPHKSCVQVFLAFAAIAFQHSARTPPSDPPSDVSACPLTFFFFFCVPPER